MKTITGNSLLIRLVSMCILGFIILLLEWIFGEHARNRISSSGVVR